MATAEEHLKSKIADCLERRRLAVTETIRVVAEFRGNVLESRSCAMAIPMLYAMWEGYAKEVLQLYIDYLEKSSIVGTNVKSERLAYMWTQSFRKLSAKASNQGRVELIDRLKFDLNQDLKFGTQEREIDTKSNLFFEQLEVIAASLCLDVSRMKIHERKRNVLVNRRNNIAHGGRETKLQEPDLHDFRDLVLDLMEGLESVVLNGVEQKCYIATLPSVV